MLDLNVILGMNFMERYEVKIDCKRKKKLFNLYDSDEFTFANGFLGVW